MAVNKRYTYVWHVGETASPFSVQVTTARGPRVDLESATFTLIDRDSSTILVHAKPCQTVSVDGLLAYAPTAAEMQTACRFMAQFTATTYAGTVLPTIHIEGEIEANVVGVAAAPPHAWTHELGGPDPVSIAGLSGVLAEPQTADTLVLPGPMAVSIGPVAEGEVLALVDGVLVGATLPAPFSVADDIAPMHWWRASDVLESGGFVDALVDQGSLPIDFTSTGAARAPVNVDADGNAYLALDGVASFYTSGGAPDWTFLSDGSPFTIAVVCHRTALITRNEVLLDTVNLSLSDTGIALYLEYASASVQGVKFFVGAPGPKIPISAISRVPDLEKTCLVLRQSGTHTDVTTGSHTPIAVDLILRRRGADICIAAKSDIDYSTASPAGPLTLGRQTAAAAGFSAARIYEIIVDDKPWSDRQIHGFENYVRMTRNLAM